MSTPAVERQWWLRVAFVLPLYAFLYDNANSWPTALGHSWTRLLPMPRPLRVVEIAAVAGLLLLAMFQGMSRVTRQVIACTGVFLALALMSYLQSEAVPLLDGVRLIYMWIMPAVLFVIGREAAWGRSAWKAIATTVLVWVAISAGVSWLQFLWFGYPVGDDITGLNKDAHANGTLMMFVALHWLAWSLFRRRPIGYAMAIGFLVTMVLSSVLKVMFLGALAVAIVVWVHVRSLAATKTRGMPVGVKWVAVGGAALLLTASAFTQLDVISSSRLGDFGDRLLNSPQNLGPIQAHTVALGKVARELPTMLLGLGPFRFANPISVGQVEGNLSLKAENDLLAIGDEKGEQARVTLSSSLMAEFGLPAFAVILTMYFGIGRALWACRLNRDPDIRWRASGLAASGLILGCLPFTSLFGSFDVMSVTFPIMLLAGIVCRESSAAAALSTSSQALP